MPPKTRIKESQFADHHEYIPQERFCFLWMTMTEIDHFGRYNPINKKTKDEAKAYIKNKYPDVIFHYPL